MKELQQRDAGNEGFGASLASELLHFSDLPLYTVNAVEQGGEPDSKPEGLWVSVGAAWLEWCLAETFAMDRFEHVTRVVLADDANVLRVDGVEALDRFNAEYRGPATKYAAMQSDRHRAIDWRRVAQQYDGIVIAPYIWERRHAPYSWYYGWDVASGCIWHPRAVASLECVDLSVHTPAEATTN